MVKHKEHRQALELRRKGWTYGMIVEELEISKGTVSLWCRDIPVEEIPQTIINERVMAARERSYQTRRKRTDAKYKKIINDVKREMPKLDLFSIGLGIYWGEGNKGLNRRTIGVTNADPALLRIAIKWMINFVKIDKTDLHYTIFVHTDVNQTDALEYWSKELDINSKIIKIIVFPPKEKPGKKRLPFGHLQVRTWNKEKLAKVLGMITGASQQSKTI